MSTQLGQKEIYLYGLFPVSINSVDNFSTNATFTLYMLEPLLAKLHLGAKEQKVYLAILEYGKIAPARISRLTKINRTTVYSVAEELKEKGLIQEDSSAKILYYVPCRGEALNKVLKLEKDKFEKKKSLIEELQIELESIPASTVFSVPKVRYVDEQDLEDFIYANAKKWERSMVGEEKTWWGFQDHTFVEHFEKWILWYWKQAPKEVDLKLFSNDSTIENHMQKKNLDRRQIRFWKGENTFTATQWVVGEYIIQIVTAGKPFYLVEIHDSVLAHNMREVFRELWNQKSA